jgi:hypothetical protein
MNPYAANLAGHSALEIIAQTPGALTTLMHDIGPEGALHAIAPGKWSPRHIVCHLADCEIAFGFRLRQALAEPNHVIQPFDQDKWSVGYDKQEAAAALAAFTGTRQWNLALIASLTPDQLALPVSHPERGVMTVQTIVETMGGHDRNHLLQLEKVAGQK